MRNFKLLGATSHNMVQVMFIVFGGSNYAV